MTKRQLIKMTQNTIPFQTSSIIIKSIKNSFNSLTSYPERTSLQLRQKLSKKFHLPSERFIVGNGSDELIQLIVRSFIKKNNDQVIVSDGTYPLYEFTCKQEHATIKKIPLNDDYSYCLENMKKSLSEKTKLIFICNPNNPTGRSIPDVDIFDFINYIKKINSHTIVVIDEAYRGFSSTEFYSNPFADLSNSIVLRSFSKMYGIAGLRVGYGIATKKIVGILEETRIPFNNVNCLGQIAAFSALDIKIKPIKNFIMKERSWISQELLRLNVRFVDSSTNFLLLDLGHNTKKIHEALLKNEIETRRCTIFGLPSTIRITIGTHKTNLRFIKIFEKILKSVDFNSTK